MRKFFYVGVIFLILFEAMNVYFIMPFPGSQRQPSIDLAYFLYRSRWNFRFVFLFLMLLGLLPAFRSHRWLTIFLVLLVGSVIWYVNFQMAADHMFYQPGSKQMATVTENRIGEEKLVIGVVQGTDARAYPIQLIAYHHQVLDTVGGKPLMVTYCSVCRTGRVFEPLVDGRPETFRLVGMDHFNAMFEDTRTGSWWRQATGEAITGGSKGKALPEYFSRQTSLKQWLRLYPDSRIMQPDTVFAEQYGKLARYDSGFSKGSLTRTDTSSWKDKSWVVGIIVKGKAKAYDWNRLKKDGVVQDIVDDVPVVIVMGGDGTSFFAFRRPDPGVLLSRSGDSLRGGGMSWDLKGKVGVGDRSLDPVPAYQEFWHSWKTFHPGTLEYK